MIEANATRTSVQIAVAVLFIALLPAGVVRAADEALALVRDGKPTATIVYGKTPRRKKVDLPGDGDYYRWKESTLRDAAYELQTYIAKATGAVLPVVTDDEPVEGTRILVGDSTHTRQLGLTNDGFERQEYLIRATEDTLILIGRDETYQEWVLNTPNGGAAFSGLGPIETYQAIGTHYAVSDFLERFCGVRWYFAGELGEVVPERKDLVIPRTEIRRRPVMRHRSMRPALMPPNFYWEDYLDNRGKAGLPFWRINYRPEDTVNQYIGSIWGRRLKLGGDAFACNHSFNILDRFRGEHPDWWPTKSTWPCLSHPQVAEAMVQDARDFFDGKRAFGPTAVGNYFAIMPQDNESWCECDRCKAQRVGDEWSGSQSSNYVWSFVAKVASEVKKTHPDKIITCCAYRTYSLAPDPDKVQLPDNVAVQLCPGFSCWLSPTADTPVFHRKWFDDWAKVVHSDNLYIWWYWLWPLNPTYQSFPNVSPYEVGAMVRQLKQRGFRGGVFCQIDENHGHWWSYPMLDHLRVYVAAKLLDDWDLDERQIVEEYYRLFYGPAEQPMKQFWEYIHQAPYDRHPSVTHPQRQAKWRSGEETKPKDWDWTIVCPPEDIEQLGRWLDEARALTPEPSVYRKRVNLIDEAVYQAYLVRASDEVLGSKD